MAEQETKNRRGFGAMDSAKQREIASKGGHAAHQKRTAHEFNSEEARKAGQKGGRTVSANREHMSAIGRKGGESSHGSRSREETKDQPPEGAQDNYDNQPGTTRGEPL